MENSLVDIQLLFFRFIEVNILKYNIKRLKYIKQSEHCFDSITGKPPKAATSDIRQLSELPIDIFNTKLPPSSGNL